MSNKHQKNPLNYRVQCKECHVAAKLRRFPPCNKKDCGVQKFVEEMKDKIERGEESGIVMQQIETKHTTAENLPKINNHALNFAKLRENLKNHNKKFISINDVDMR